MADYSLNEWWQMRHSPVDNPLPALQLGASIVQHRAQQDLQERELGNQIARTSLMRDEMLAKQKIQTMLTAGNAAFAGALANVTDFNDDEQWADLMAEAARNPMSVGGKAYLGAMHMRESARTAKRLEEETRSRIAARTDRTTLNNLVEQRRALLADSTIDLNDARIAKYDKDIAYEERRMAVQEGNLKLRGQEVGLKEQRLNATGRWSAEDKIEFQNRAKKAVELLTDPEDADRVIQEIREDIEGKRQQREGFKAKKVERQGIQPAPAAAVTPPAPIAPGTNRVSVVSPDGKPGTIPESQLEEALKAGYKRP